MKAIQSLIAHYDEIYSAKDIQMEIGILKADKNWMSYISALNQIVDDFEDDEISHNGILRKFSEHSGVIAMLEDCGEQSELRMAFLLGMISMVLSDVEEKSRARIALELLNDDDCDCDNCDKTDCANRENNG